MRIDKFLSECGLTSRTEAAKAAKSGLISVNGEIITKANLHIDPEVDKVTYKNEAVTYRKFTFVMLNKPDGYLSSTEDGSGATVMDLLPKEFFRMGLFPCGRLDKDTTGLLIMTNDGESAHKLLSPKNHVPKTYSFQCASPLTATDKSALESGVSIGGYVTKKSSLTVNPDCVSGTITITEGKFHQIKRMFEAVQNKITRLERIAFNKIPLDPKLPLSKWRHLTEEEIASLQNWSETGSETDK